LFIRRFGRFCDREERGVKARGEKKKRSGARTIPYLLKRNREEESAKERGLALTRASARKVFLKKGTASR